MKSSAVYAHWIAFCFVNTLYNHIVKLTWLLIVYFKVT